MTKYIDDLLARVTDPSLREDLQREIFGLSKQQKFGLVFEHHKPESVELPNTKIRKGSVVRLRAFTTVGTSTRQVRDDRLFRVLAVNSQPDGIGTPIHTANIVSKPTLSTVEVPVELTVAVSELVAVAEFGTPVYPGLKHTGSAVHAQSTAAKNKPSHVVIKGENFHVLQALTFTHENSVDCIYIDPPYNTGGDFTYNDQRVSKEDLFRHSKWLSFMNKRLQLAKRLLKDTGVIIVAIDDNEHAHLRLLMDQIFGEQNFISNVVWQGKVKSGARFGGGGQDYMLVYAKSVSVMASANVRWKEEKRGVVEVLQAGQSAWVGSGDDQVAATKAFKSWWKSKAPDVDPGMKMYCEIDGTGRVFATDNPSAPDRPETRSHRALIHPITGLPCRVPAKGWSAPDETMNRWLLEDRIAFGSDETKMPRIKRFLQDLQTQSPSHTIVKERVGTRELERVMGEKRFDFPKDTNVLARWIGLVTSQNRNAVVLDFFGGSGSTLHAVMEMNAAGGGQRQCILITNNEVETKQATELTKAGHFPGDVEWEAWGVLERVTRPRISTVVTGVRAHLDGSTYSAGLPDERVEFFDLTHEDPGAIRLARAYKAIEPLLWLRAGAIGAYEFTNGGTTTNPVVIASPYAVLHDVNYSADFIAKVNADPTITHPFVVTESSATFQAIVRSLTEDRRDNAMRLYKGYAKTFETNTQETS